jgi:hypothetical protein
MAKPAKPAKKGMEAVIEKSASGPPKRKPMLKRKAADAAKPGLSVVIALGKPKMGEHGGNMGRDMGREPEKPMNMAPMGMKDMARQLDSLNERLSKLETMCKEYGMGEGEDEGDAHEMAKGDYAEDRGEGGDE